MVGAACATCQHPSLTTCGLLATQASQPGIRIIWSNDDEEEDEDEDWGDILEELGNPWQMEPGKCERRHERHTGTGQPFASTA